MGQLVFAQLIWMVDGKPDIAVTDIYASNISILRNTSTIGTISFSTSSYSYGTSPTRLELADLDMDGKPDLIIADKGSSPNNIKVYRNTSTSGTISFTSVGSFTTGSTSKSCYFRLIWI